MNLSRYRRLWRNAADRLGYGTRAAYNDTSNTIWRHQRSLYFREAILRRQSQRRADPK